MRSSEWCSDVCSSDRTWRDLTDTTRAIVAAEQAAGDGDLQGFVWQGRAYEGLTCNALEWIASQGGGSIVDADGEVTIDNDAAAAALDLAASRVGPISPRGVLDNAAGDSRGRCPSARPLSLEATAYA